MISFHEQLMQFICNKCKNIHQERVPAGTEYFIGVRQFIGNHAVRCPQCFSDDVVAYELSDELLPCPFCGQPGEVVREFETNWFPRCTNQDCLMSNPTAGDEQGGIMVDFPTKQEAAIAWNTRTYKEV
jgi:Restriction alleviation protein Lar